ncbi:MAG: GNAT family N-acetyltransferase [Acidimicrobiia bacterium]|nr:GNAT family N-acetyltransferase [Acidimicrobiia bacterium]
MAIDIRPITADEIPAFRKVINRAFGGDAKNDDESVQRFKEQVDLDRTYAAFEDGNVVATAATFSFEMSLPGGAMTPMGGLTMVSVVPTHRRRGLMSRLMTAHFEDCIGRGEVVGGLWASESSIYGRYGYGNACPVVKVNFDSSKAGVPPAPDTTRIVDISEAKDAMKSIYAQVLPKRPGQLARSEVWWEHRHFRDAPEWRDGATERRYVVAYRDGDPVGYTTFRQKSKWDDGMPGGSIVVGEVMGIDTEARLSLWSLVSSVDLFPNVEAWDVPIDWELPYQVDNPRAIKRLIGDGQYVRVLDVPGALTARGYQSEDSIVISVDDPQGFTGGVYRFHASPDGSEVVEVDEEPEVAVSITTLGQLYLGATGAGSLARAGKIRGEEDAVRRFSRLLLSDPAPWCPEVY